MKEHGNRKDAALDEDRISEDEAIKVAEKHLGALTKLLAIPLPLVCVVMIGLATSDETVEIAGFKIPHDYAEYAARTVVLLIFAQCCTHLLTMVAMTNQAQNSIQLRRAVAFHPGTFNPFFSIEKSNKLMLALRILLIPGFAGKLAVGFIIGFVQGFRIRYAPGLVSNWYRLGSYIVWPFSKSLSEEWAQRSHEIVQFYIGAVTRWDLYADFLTLATFFLSVSIVCAIVYLISSLWPWPRGEERSVIAAFQLAVSGFVGWLTAVLLSNAIRTKGAAVILWFGTAWT
jgi:hypothetical protein